MTLYSELVSANLPVVSATEDGAIVMLAMTDAQQVTFSNVILNHFNPTAYNNLQALLADKQSLADEYANAVSTLTTIENTVSPTNAQVVSAVKYMAKIVRYILRVFVKLL